MYGITIKMLDPWGRESQKKGKQSTQINFCQTKCISWLTCFNGALVIMCGKLEFSKGWVWIFWQKTKGGSKSCSHEVLNQMESTKEVNKHS